MNTQSKPFQVERRGNGQRSPMKPPKPRAWNHQDDLKALKGTTLRITFADAAGKTPELGKLLEADQFTIKLEVGGREHVFFKSALRSFCAVKGSLDQ